MNGPSPTPLGAARIRFMATLPERREALLRLAAELAAIPEDKVLALQLQDQLHSLSASAIAFEEVQLSQRIKAALDGLDERPEGKVPGVALEAVADVAGTLERLMQQSQRPTTSALVPRGGADPNVQAPASPTARESTAVVDDTAIDVVETVSGLLASPRPVQPAIPVFVVDDEEVLRSVDKALPEGRYDVCGSWDPDHALRLMHATRPHVVLIGVELARDARLDLVRRIRRDPVTDVRHVLLLGRQVSSQEAAQLGCDGALRRPIDPGALSAMLDDLLHEPSDLVGGLGGLTEGTVDDIADRVAQEIRMGLTESLQVGRDERIELADNRELMAAAWSAIGRIRAELGQRSAGRLRFSSPQPGSGPPGAVDQRREHSEAADAAHADAIQGRRVVVADDDPAVLWFFSGLLREAGATVIEARDGREALRLCRARRPHVVISDILMPKLDGFGLCKALARDVVLCRVPVVLLSWKQDYLERMREMGVGAKGYLRKEAGGSQILRTVSDVLRPRALIEAQLEGAHQVMGRLESIGIVPLIEAVAVRRPNARILVSDAWNLFEITLRGGDQIGVTRTATDGMFARGEAPLRQLLGVTQGRFRVEPGSGEVQPWLAGPLDAALQEAAESLASTLAAVSSRNLLRVARVTVDEGAVPGFLAATPAPLGALLLRVQDGAGDVQAWLADPEIGPEETQRQLEELARRGLLTGVFDGAGHDMIAAARQARHGAGSAVVHLSERPPSEVMNASQLPEWYTDAAPGTPLSSVPASVSEEGLQLPAPSGEGAEVLPTAQTQPPIRLPAPSASPAPPADAAADPFETEPPVNAPPVNTPPVNTPPASAMANAPSLDSGMPAWSDGASEAEFMSGLVFDAASDATPTAPQGFASRGSVHQVSSIEEIGSILEAFPSEDVPDGPLADEFLADELLADEPLADELLADELMTDELRPDELRVDGVAPVADQGGTVLTGAVASARRSWPPHHDDDEPDAWAEEGLGSHLLALFMVGLMGVLGYMAYGFLARQQGSSDPLGAAAPVEPRRPSPDGPRGLDPERPAPEPAAPARDVAARDVAARDADGFGRELPGIEAAFRDRVAEGQGLLKVEAPESGRSVLFVDDRRVGVPPVALALAPGRHSLVFKQGPESRYRFIVIRAGRTRLVSVP